MHDIAMYQIVIDCEAYYFMKPLVISFSGGRTSAYMTKLLIDKYKGLRDIIVIFANTGKEREETLKFIKDCDDYFGFNTIWIEAAINPNHKETSSYKIVTFETAARNGEPFEQVISKYGLPNPAAPHCSRDLKKVPIENYFKTIGIKDYEIALGIRHDELKRAKPKPKIIYPLIKEFPTTKIMVNKWWHKQPFNLNLKGYEGNCDLCWKKSKRKLLTIILENPQMANWWNDMEIKYGEFVPESRKHNALLELPIVFFRNNESTQDLIEDSKQPFRKATDDFTLTQLMHSEPELDFTNGCEESCEAF